MNFTITIRIADISPISLSIAGDQFNLFFHKKREEIFGKVKVFSFGDIVKDLRFYNIDTGIDRIAEDFSPARLFEELFDRTFIIGDNDTKFQRILNGCQCDRKLGFFLFMVVKDLLKIKVSHQVAADNNKVIITDEILCQLDGTRSTIIIIRNNISNIHTKVAAVTKIVLDHLRLEIEKNNKIFNPQFSEGDHRIFHHWSVDNRQHWFRS